MLFNFTTQDFEETQCLNSNKNLTGKFQFEIPGEMPGDTHEKQVFQGKAGKVLDAMASP